MMKHRERLLIAEVLARAQYPVPKALSQPSLQRAFDTHVQDATTAPPPGPGNDCSESLGSASSSATSASPALKKRIKTGITETPRAREMDLAPKSSDSVPEYSTDTTLGEEETLENRLFGLSKEDASEARWQFHFQQLKEYQREQGDCLVSRPHSALGAWVYTQRVMYSKSKRGEMTPLTKKRILLLESIGFVWDDYEKRWHDHFQEVVQYKNEKGNCLVPRSYPPNPKLGRWVYTQRTRYNQAVLSPERVKKLESIGFVWRIFSRSNWQECYQELAEFKGLYGHCRVPRKYDENRKLGRWVQTQRTEMKNLRQGKPSRMTDERIKLLNDLRFEWKVNQTREK